MMIRPATLALTLGFLIAFVGCTKMIKEEAPPGRVVAISLFKCNCEPLVQESVQDTFLDVFFKSTNTKPIKGDNGYITIIGIITMGDGYTGKSEGEAFGGRYAVGASTSSATASGSYVSGITVQVYKNNELIATNSNGQNLDSGSFDSHINLARDTAEDIAEDLIDQNEIGDK